MSDAPTTAAPGLSDEEKQKELEGRIENFNKELVPLLGKFELGLGASAFVQPNGTIGARPILFDNRQNTPSPVAPTAAGEAADSVEPPAAATAA